MANSFNFDAVKKHMEQVKRELPQIIANDTQNAFVDNFKKQGFFGKPWQLPQRRIKGSASWKYPKTRGLSRRTKPTLTMTGRLRGAVATSKRTVKFDNITLAVYSRDIPYANVHNESGGNNIPKRQFMGDSPVLQKRQLALIKKYIDSIWR